MLINLDQSQLVCMDYQMRLMPTMWEQETVLANAVRLVRLAHQMQVPAFYTEQNPRYCGSTVEALQAPLQQANARLLSKMQFSAVEEGLSEWLRPPAKPVQGNARSLPKHLQKSSSSESDRNTVIVAGCEAHICLLQTALQLLEDDFDVWVVSDACSSRTERNRDAAFDRLASAGVELVTTEMVAFEWLRSAESPEFEAVQALVN